MPKYNIITNKIYSKTIEYETNAKNSDEAFKNYSDFKNIREVKESSLDFLEEQLLHIDDVREMTYLQSKDKHKFAEWATKRKAEAIFGDDHEIVRFRVDEVIAYGEIVNCIEEITIDMTIVQHGYDEIGAFTFSRSMSLPFKDDDFKQFYKESKND